jgi:anthranilate synthase/aminodeoxychorismate synthase-like glutamine amidotransferase
VYFKNSKLHFAMLFILDNYDSFTYNLVQYFGELGAEMKIVRNDQITVEEVKALRPDHICISPGPCSPNEAGISCDLIRELGPSTPILGVCLGHQSIGQVYGGDVVRADRLMHGKTSPIHHAGKSVFAGMVNPFQATRYHSLIVKRETLPSCLEVTAWTEEGEIMGLAHATYPVHGVQFHPESILTQDGKHLLANFLKM